MNFKAGRIFMGLVPAVLPLSAKDFSQTGKPNIVWFLTEDVSSHYLALFNEGKGCSTPNVQRLARHGVLFRNAYSNAPVSSAARTTLITGCYAPAFGGSLHRSIQQFPVPEGLSLFPAYLRKAGYYTCNSEKTDYNVKMDKEAWDIVKGELGSWRERPDKSKPFFFMRSNTMTHESRLQFNSQTFLNRPARNNPAEVHMHPGLPDTELMRYTYATFYDRIEDSDRELGELVDMLEKEGELENTFIFYFGDNGGSLPGTKGYTYDIGFHVPLVVYIPERWKERISREYGSIEEEPVSFMDFAPTVLELAGEGIPDRMDGHPFLSEVSGNRERSVVGYGDRYDECYIFNRCIRKGKYRYARNYQPYHPRSLFAMYRYKQPAFREWKSMYVKGELTEEQSAFFRPMGAEELYDLESDPFELHNLAGKSEYGRLLRGMREELNAYMEDKADLGFFPETVIYEEGKENPSAFGKENRRRIAKLIGIADLQTCKYSPSLEKRLCGYLSSEDPVVRWWALTVCASFGKEALPLLKEILPLLQDERSYIRMRAVVALSIMGKVYEGKDILPLFSDTRTVAENLLLLNDLTFLFEEGLTKPFQISTDILKYRNFAQDWRIRYLASFLVSDDWSVQSKDIYRKK